jgi:hypothetical protein
MTCHCKIKFLINESGIPFRKRNNPEYQTKRNILESTLNEPGLIDRACIHEAGHLIFFAEMGVTEFHYQVPSMESNGAGFDYTLAAIRLKPSQKVDIDNQQALPDLAKAAAAGGVFLHKLRDQIDGRDSDDRIRFYLHCIRLGYDNMKKELWEEGQGAVEERLRQSAFRVHAEQIASQLKLLLFFPILGSQSTPRN